jgi:hypothetical protein
MDFRVAAPGRGLAWFQQAIRMLDRNPRGLIQVAAFYVLLHLAPNLLEFVPALMTALSVVLLLLYPALLGGLMYAISEADAGRPIASSMLFEGLRRPGVRGQLLVLGTFTLLAILLIALSASRIVDEQSATVLKQVLNQKLQADSPAAQAAFVPLFKAMTAAAAILFVLFAGLFFAIPRVMFDARAAAPALLESFIACAANVLSLTVFGLMFFAAGFMLSVAFSILAAILAALGQVGSVLSMVAMVALVMVWTLVTASGNFLAWREVFGRSATDYAPPQAGIIV